MINSKAKGKTGELELCRVLTDAGFPARRGQQYHGRPGSPDIVCESLPLIHWECKRVERLHLYKALEQAKNEKAVIEIPVVAHRQSGREWVAVLPLSDLLDILRESELSKPTVGDAVEVVGGEIVDVKGGE